MNYYSVRPTITTFDMLDFCLVILSVCRRWEGTVAFSSRRFKTFAKGPFGLFRPQFGMSESKLSAGREGEAMPDSGSGIMPASGRASNDSSRKDMYLEWYAPSCVIINAKTAHFRGCPLYNGN